jgi:hypothetical protein
MTMRQRLTRLEARLPPPPSPEIQLQMQRCGPIFDRWHDLGAAASELMCPEEQDRVLRAVQQLHETWLGPYGVWFWYLCEGRCRLPMLAPQVMKDLLLAWLSPDVASGYLCERCGLLYPFRYWPRRSEPTLWADVPQGLPVPEPLPEFFTTCPHCGCAKSDLGWPADDENDEPAWKDLDGCAGSRIVGGMT